MKHHPFTIERRFEAPVSMVWKALTDKHDMKQWYFDLPEFEAKPGFEFQFYGGPPEKQYLHLCTVTEVVPEKKLAYSWRYDGYGGNSLVIFELFADGNSTILKLTHEGLETFPATNPDFAEERFADGWTFIVNTSLTEFLNERI